MTTRQLTPVALLLTFCLAVPAAEQSSIELVSKPQQTQARSFGDSGELQLSNDGKWAVFTSTGNGIVTNDHNGFNLDVFLRNDETGETVLVSGDNSASGVQGNGDSYMARMSPDANFIVFQSDADNLVEGDENEDTDAFVYARAANELTLLSVDAEGIQLEGSSGAPVISPDGKIFLIETTAAASDLDTNDSVDLYRISPGGLDLVSTRSNSLEAASVAFPTEVLGSFEASMTPDGRYITFISAGTNHVAGVPDNAAAQVYLRDMTAETNAWLSRAPNGAAATMVQSPVISTNGEFVLFLSSPLPAVAGTTGPILYRYELASGTLSQVTSFGSVDFFELSENGRYVALTSSNQVYLHDLVAGTNTLMSRSAEGSPGAGISSEPAISADGRFVIFTSSATNLVEGATNEVWQLYRFDRENSELAMLSRALAGSGADGDVLFPTISADGSKAGFFSIASNFGLNDDPRGNDVFIVPTSGAGNVTLASAPHPLSISITPLNQSVLDPNAISLDGRFVIFSSDAPDIMPNDTNAMRDIFLRDLQSGTTEWVSRLWWGAQHPENSTFIGASLDGMIIAYLSSELVGDTLRRGVYVRDRRWHSNYFASMLPDFTPATNVAMAVFSPTGEDLVFRQVAGTGPLYVTDGLWESRQITVPAGVVASLDPHAISPSGKYLLTRGNANTYLVHDLRARKYLTNFTSFGIIAQPFTADDSAALITASGPTVNERPLVLFALEGGANEVIATNATPLVISTDGSKVAYQKSVEGVRVLYFYDRNTQISTPFTLDGTNVNVRVNGTAAFSLDGRFFTFLATNDFTTANSSHSFNKLYRYDTLLKTIRLVSQSAAGDVTELPVGSPSVSANGRLITFETSSANLIPGDLNLSTDVFLARLAPTDSNDNGVEDGWEVIHFGALIDNATADSDGDGVNNRDEYLGGTDPKSATSLFGIAMDADHEVRSFVLTVPASPGLTYQLELRSSFSNDEWSPFGNPQVAFSTSISFDMPLLHDSNAFFRVSVVR